MTSYMEVYDSFTRKITDYTMLDLSDSDVMELCHGYLMSAIPRMKSIVSDLSKRDEELQSFTIDLLDVEIEILACLMVVEWINPQLNSTLYTSQFFGSKDEKFYSQKNQIDGLRDLKHDMQQEARKLRRDYITDNHDYLKRQR